ncbi:adhesion G protein-coupled receptor E1-like [Pristis pectinata]|uniref:adhesion G protein-coupled receptor E1-like n=1 Tax=Pristis pectinata TaxID=685728 RepID=UPI00223D5493|nr:adhesion G protein-coupled receptor E1-like [Pristis pectinata]
MSQVTTGPLQLNRKSRQHSSFMESGRLPFLLVLLLHNLLAVNAVPSAPCSPSNTGKCVESAACRSHTCPYGSECVAKDSEHRCHCKKGFKICMVGNSCTTGRPYCKDINECNSTSMKCDMKENCLNTIGDYCCLNGKGHISCTECERSCRINGTKNGKNSTESDQVCISACEIQTLYQRVSAVNRQPDQLNNIIQLLDKTESMMMSLVEAPSNQLEERQSMEAFEIGIKRQANASEPLTISVLGHTVEVGPAILMGVTSGRVPAAGLIVHKHLDGFLCNDTGAKPGPQGATLGSRVITMVIGNRKNNSLTQPLIFTFAHNETNKDNFIITCVYWDHTSTKGFWSPEGCELMEYNSTHTVCKANHLSSFAVLMALKALPDVFEVQLITIIGLSISLLCLLLAIVTFYTCQPQKDTRCSIHLNLCQSLFMADFIFLFGISQTSNEITCGFIAAILHYLFLAVFVWMLLEGIQLYLLVEVVFEAKVPLERYIYWVGYGLPAVIVAISAAANPRGYGTPTACWLSPENCFSCSFFVPVIFICVVNLIILCKTLMKLSHVISDQSIVDRNRVFTLTAIGQLVILGCTWILGGFFIQNATVPMMYIFTIFNSFQGMFIYIMHCLMRKKVRDSYRNGFRRCFRRSLRWAPVSTSSSSSNQVRRSVQETESTSGAVQ